MQQSLSLKIWNKESLTETEQAQILGLVTSRCNERTKRMVARALRCVPDIKDYGIYTRVLIEDDNCHYCAGQSYPDEIRTVRECLKGC